MLKKTNLYPFLNNFECETKKELACSNSKLCECKNEINNEFFWFDGSCIPKRDYKTSCHNDAACQTLTQHTFCKNTSNSLKCDCASDKYWNGTRCGKNLEFRFVLNFGYIH